MVRRFLKKLGIKPTWWFSGLVAKLCPTLAIPWTVACQAPLSVGFSGQEYWSGLPLPSPLKPPYDPAIPLLGIYTKETGIERDTCIPLFTAALFIITKTWKQPRCPSTDEWIKKLWYIYTMEYQP